MEVKMDITTSDFYLFTLLLFYLSRLLAHLLLLAPCSFILPPLGGPGWVLTSYPFFPPSLGEGSGVGILGRVGGGYQNCA